MNKLTQISEDLIHKSEALNGGIKLTPLTRTGEEWVLVNGDKYDLVHSDVTWLSQESIIEARNKAEAKALKESTKINGIDFKGVGISLNESNQNGIAAVKSGEELANEYGGTVFPLNFNAETANGIEKVTFTDFAEFKTFGLQFIQARQAVI